MTMTNLSQVIPELAPLPQGNDKQDTKPYVSVNWGYGPGKPVVIARGINKQRNKYCILQGSNKAIGFCYHNRTNYYEDYRGRWKLTFPDGRILRGIKPKGRGIGKKRSLLTLTLLATPQPLNLAAMDVPPAEAKEGEEQDSQMCGA